MNVWCLTSHADLVPKLTAALRLISVIKAALINDQKPTLFYDPSELNAIVSAYAFESRPVRQTPPITLYGT